MLCQDLNHVSSCILGANYYRFRNYVFSGKLLPVTNILFWESLTSEIFILRRVPHLTKKPFGSKRFSKNVVYAQNRKSTEKTATPPSTVRYAHRALLGNSKEKKRRYLFANTTVCLIYFVILITLLMLYFFDILFVYM